VKSVTLAAKHRDLGGFQAWLLQNTPHTRLTFQPPVSKAYLRGDGSRAASCSEMLLCSSMVSPSRLASQVVTSSAIRAVTCRARRHINTFKQCRNLGQYLTWCGLMPDESSATQYKAQI